MTTDDLIEMLYKEMEFYVDQAKEAEDDNNGPFLLTMLDKGLSILQFLEKNELGDKTRRLAAWKKMGAIVFAQRERAKKPDESPLLDPNYTLDSRFPLT